MIEIQVAFAILGIGLAGLCPFVVMQIRQVRVLERRLQGQVTRLNRVTGESQTMLEAKTYYLMPWQNPWTRKLAGSGQILDSDTSPCDPGPLPVRSPSPPQFPVAIISLDAPPCSEDVTAVVDVMAP
jgi:type II secretory pathway pseudopilin PulG